MLSKTSQDKFLVLEDSKGTFDLITIKTSVKTKKEMKEEIRINLRTWLKRISEKSPHFHDIETKLDLAIVVYRKKGYLGRQDLDNIAKIVLDALEGLLFKNDSQVVRLLLFKKDAKLIEGFKTDAIAISFREHNPNKEMTLSDVTSF